MTTIVTFRPGDTPSTVKLALDKTSVDVPGDWRDLVIDLSQHPLADWQESDACIKRGTVLRGILDGEPSVKQALAGVLAHNGNNPIYVRALSRVAETLDWELLFDAERDRFVALGDTTPIGRTTKSSPSGGRMREPLPRPFRIVAVISAAGAGQTGMTEWQALKQARDEAVAAGIDVALTVITGEPALFDAVTAAGIAVELLPGRADQLARRLHDLNPHVLHLYGHGGEQAAVPFLELATKADFVTANERGSLVLTAQDFRGAIRGLPIWLLVLNCCSGASGSLESRSLARRLVEDEHVPAAVGMAAPVSPADVALFTSTLYGALLNRVGELIGAGAGEIDWAGLLSIPRRELCRNRDPRLAREWALPIVYALEPSFHPQFTVETPPSLAGGGGAAAPPELSSAERVKLKTIADFLATLPEGQEKLREDVRKRVLDGIPEEFWPDLSGKFPSG